MTATIQQLTRVFRVSTQTFPDPAPTESPERAFAMLAVAMPALAHYTLDAPAVEGNQLVFTASRPPAQTKGAPRRGKTGKSSPDDGAKASIRAWADAPSTAGYDPQLHASVSSALRSLAKRAPGKVDPFVVAMA